MPIKWPGPSDRVVVIGRTGSGKTVAGVWHLSGKDFKRESVFVLNTKGDPLLNQIARIQGVKTISIDDRPAEPGLYIVNTVPDQALEIDMFLRWCWERGDCVVYIDELYMVDETDALNAILTQGRSRNVAFIGLSQRPAWVTKFVFSETDFVQLFNLQIRDDRKKIGQLVPISPDYSLRKHHSYWYNVGDDVLTQLGPVPPPDTLLERIRVKFSAEPSPEAPQVTETVEVSEAGKGRNYL